MEENSIFFCQNVTKTQKMYTFSKQKLQCDSIYTTIKYGCEYDYKLRSLTTSYN